MDRSLQPGYERRHRSGTRNGGRVKSCRHRSGTRNICPVQPFWHRNGDRSGTGIYQIQVFQRHQVKSSQVKGMRFFKAHWSSGSTVLAAGIYQSHQAKPRPGRSCPDHNQSRFKPDSNQRPRVDAGNFRKRALPVPTGARRAGPPDPTPRPVTRWRHE